VTARSERRFDEFLLRLLTAVPAVTIGSESRLTLGQVAAQNPASPRPPNLDDPAAAEMLATIMGGYEGSLTRDSIPALGGITPRQAADDPTRRGDLIRLLASFDDFPAGPGTMNVGRLRAALGLVVDAGP
jgi:hypothetical protein